MARRPEGNHGAYTKSGLLTVVLSALFSFRKRQLRKESVSLEKGGYIVT